MKNVPRENVTTPRKAKRRKQRNSKKMFLSLVKKHFENNKLKKIFNKNTIKISYSCMPNMKNIIDSHNKKIINKDQAEEKRRCNCRQKNQCPMKGECLVEDAVYKATVETRQGNATYIGIASGQFKTRYNNHTKSFRDHRYEKSTELSKYIWNLKRNNTPYEIKWEIAKRSNTNIRKTGTCNLCLDEKTEIIRQKTETNVKTLNKRSELISTCRHQRCKARGKNHSEPVT